ncbi:GTP 3',8-cyclase MoaA [Oceanisphaera avium]|uniref:GTP 3',8-cyclase n=1 Tax=Oceanisphaera avium TaxID=1903694 RepID=A0A1Y0CW12_9GAMM|nr:GTP 3',8-cyclase MoaA [Oceanisphaera avium]ART79521.1 GTP 3',8-cyclase MoaA [Oceanisphaera avium]
MLELKDAHARKFQYLRLSITDVCNFKCQYCLPDGYMPDGRKSFLTVSEIAHLTRGFAAMGTTKVRLTGGEPSLRKDFTHIIETVANTSGIEKVAMTTNGYRMAKFASQWREAGLDAINVSVDSLDPRMFHQITGQNRFHEVMAGIDAALEAGFKQVKVNAVLMRGLNDNGLGQFLAWIKDNPIQLRFIELMQTGEMDELFARHHVRGSVIKEQLLQQGWQQKLRAHNDGPAEVFVHGDYCGEIGLIMPYAKDFCATCNRLRVSSLGKLHLCLFGDYGVDLRDLLSDASQITALQVRLQEALLDKKATHFLHQGHSGMTPHLASIGG